MLMLPLTVSRLPACWPASTVMLPLTFSMSWAAKAAGVDRARARGRARTGLMRIVRDSVMGQASMQEMR
ncbi:hypothetical protein D3C84_1152820 [compost metagenome]